MAQARQLAVEHELDIDHESRTADHRLRIPRAFFDPTIKRRQNPLTLARRHTALYSAG
jgi:hypothetical protein